jgi:hypothetical protein
MKIGKPGPVLVALPLRAKETPQAGDPQALGKVLWSSQSFANLPSAKPPFAKILGGPIGSLARAGKLNPVKFPDSRARKIAELLDIGSDNLGDILDKGVEGKQISEGAAGLFKASIAGVEIYCECASPSDKSALEKALFLWLKAAIVLEPVTDFVPALHSAKPYLVGLIEMGGQALAAVRMNGEEAQEFHVIATRKKSR